MAKIISLAIATYNMEQYLERCLDSVLLPDLSDRIEVIVVNDGSTDKSLSIIKQYKEKHPDSIVLIDKTNGHLGSCWNAALKVAMGKYFRILDPDDWFDRMSFEQFVHKLSDTTADMVLTNYSYEFAGHKKSRIAVEKTVPLQSDFIYDIHEYDFGKNNHDKFFEMHATTYRTALLQRIGLHFTEGVYYVDTEYMFYPIHHVKNFVFFDLVLYKYFIGREGQSVSASSTVKNKEHIYIIFCKMMAYISKSSENQTKIVRTYWCHLLKLLTGSYYAATLLYGDPNDEEDKKLRTIDLKLKEFDDDLYRELGNCTCYRKMKYISMWRKNGVYCGKTFWYILLERIRLIFILTR
jgi:glycosyltransferase involved in cell wall biosynthesis